MLRSVLLFTAVVLLALASASAPARSPQAASASNSKNPGRMPAQSLAQAKAVYGRDCAICHGDTGDGKTDIAKSMELTMLDWTDPKTLSGQSDQALFAIIRNGKGKMPPEDEGRAKNDDVHGLVTYIRKFAKEQATPPAPATEQPAPAGSPAPTPQPAPSR